MVDAVLITGGSGYLGGTVLNRLKNAKLAQHKLYALVRSDAQAESVKQYGAEPLQFDLQNEKAIQESILKHGINIVFFLIDAFNSHLQNSFIKALTQLKKDTGQEVHFVHTTGAKMFSSLVGAPQHQFYDDDANLYEVQKSQLTQTVPFPGMLKAIETNNLVIEECKRSGVRGYIFIPCIVYGKGEGFGNPISIQTVAIVKAAKALGAVYRFEENSSWPVCHVADTATLYIALLQKILDKDYPDSGQHGYYLASSGNVRWEDIYKGVASSMVQRGVIKDSTVHDIDDASQEKMAVALDSPKEMVAAQLSGNCLLGARHGGSRLGWKFQYPAEHLVQDIDTEVELILQNLK